MRLRNPEVRIENTSKCNARCIMCPRDKMTRPKVTMPTEHFEKLVEESKSIGAKTISIFGYGEPLLDDDIVRKVRICHDLNLETFITTNASTLDVEKTQGLLKAGLSHIRFSFHGMTNYEKVHVGLDFFLTFRHINNFLVINNKRFDHSCKVSMSIIPMFGEDIDCLREYWESKVDWLEIWKPHNWTDGRSYREIVRKKKTCGRPFTGPVQINADGKIMVCCFDFDAKLTVGDTYQNNITEILRGDKFNEIRKKHDSGDLSGLVCEKCDQLNIEDENPLLYSSRDPVREINKTSSTKFKICDV